MVVAASTTRLAVPYRWLWLLGSAAWASWMRPELPTPFAQMMKNSPASKSDLNNDQRVSHQTGTTIGN